jgi:hypothetical protein
MMPALRLVAVTEIVLCVSDQSAMPTMPHPRIALWSANDTMTASNGLRTMTTAAPDGLNNANHGARRAS